MRVRVLFQANYRYNRRVITVAFRIHNFSLRLTEQEIASYEHLARESGVPVGEWMRGVLNWEVKVKQESAEQFRKEQDNNG